MPVIGFTRINEAPERVLQDKLSRVPPENQDADAYIRWGQSGSDPTFQPRIITITPWPNDPTDPTDPTKKIYTYNEIAREEVEVKVVNPDDDQQYVMVKRLKTVTFSSPDGIDRKFVLNWPTT